MCVIENTPRIETRRLVLRAPEQRDAPRIAEFCGDFEVARMTALMPHPYALDDAESFISRLDGGDPDRDKVFLVEHETWGPVGMIGFHLRHDDPYPEMGYWIGRPYWGRGIATEAAQAALDWAARSWRRRAVGAGHFVDNPASGRVLEKAGFLYTGRTPLRGCVARGGDVECREMVWLA
jgi:RimJ/RimL family protein N-acetyltransferase